MEEPTRIIQQKVIKEVHLACSVSPARMRTPIRNCSDTVRSAAGSSRGNAASSSNTNTLHKTAKLPLRRSWIPTASDVYTRKVSTGLKDRARTYLYRTIRTLYSQVASYHRGMSNREYLINRPWRISKEISWRGACLRTTWQLNQRSSTFLYLRTDRRLR